MLLAVADKNYGRVCKCFLMKNLDLEVRFKCIGLKEMLKLA